MDYFILQQDYRYYQYPNIVGFNEQYNRRDFVSENAYKIPDRNIVFSNISQKVNYIDYLNTPIILISEKIKKVFSMYDKSLLYKYFCILNNQTSEYGNYYVPIVNTQKEINGKCIVKLEQQKGEFIVVRLDVAESLLRRNVRGVKLLPLENSN